MKTNPFVILFLALFDNTITFFYEDATIDLPPFDMGHSGDIYFQFKTTAENGVLVHSRGPTDYIKIMLVGKLILFLFSLPVSLF